MDTETYAEVKSGVMMGAETGIMSLQSKKCQED